MEQLLTDTLRAWREAERLMLQLPVGLDHELVRQAMIELRDLYQAITAPMAPTPERPAVARSQVAWMIEMMDEVRTRLGISV